MLLPREPFSRRIGERLDDSTVAGISVNDLGKMQRVGVDLSKDGGDSGFRPHRLEFRVAGGTQVKAVVGKQGRTRTLPLPGRRMVKLHAMKASCRFP
jgi:hypothetical protein